MVKLKINKEIKLINTNTRHNSKSPDHDRMKYLKSTIVLHCDNGLTSARFGYALPKL